ncbi:protein NinF [Enterobacter hormaechei]|uniref:protein NinF n=1 Tax=Enterobacter hormaechei TaxID=158836 RepID=UPI000E306BA9|nr:protein NinF [Enterobacter hormaechei]RFF35219.1 NinF family protein [Enterobacter hormaechei]RFF35278.1 NinF family protein [Enterobacter hormaechei]
MLSQSEAQSYEQQSIRRTLCAGCTKELADGEAHVFEECAEEFLVYRDTNRMIEDERNG